MFGEIFRFLRAGGPVVRLLSFNEHHLIENKQKRKGKVGKHNQWLNKIFSGMVSEAKKYHTPNQSTEDTLRGNETLATMESRHAVQQVEPYTASEGLVQCMDPTNLFAAWEKVLSNKGTSGCDGVTLEQYSRNVLGRLQQLRSIVLNGNYTPAALKEHWIKRPNGGQRKLSIPSIQDRIVQTAVAQWLGPRFEAQFENASYGYRPGRSVAMAVARVCRYRDQGNLWVVEADIDGFFDNLNHKRLFELYRQHVKDRSIEQLIKMWIQIPVKSKNKTVLLERGVPQGSPLSPLLANLYLNEFDERLLAKNFNLVRFADDFVVLCKTRSTAQQARHDIEEELNSLRLKLNLHKTRVTTFANQFVFLGVRFAGNLIEPVKDSAEPWVIPSELDYKLAGQHEVAEAIKNLQTGSAIDNLDKGHEAHFPDGTGAYPDVQPRVEVTDAQLPSESLGNESSAAQYSELDTLAVQELESAALQAESIREIRPAGLQGLYVASHGHAIGLNTDRVEVWVNREKKQSIPMGQIDHVLITGRGMISTSFLNACHQHKVSCLIAPEGKQLTGLGHITDYPSAALIGQLARMRDLNFRLMMARAIVKAKLHNSRVVLRRFARREDGDFSARIQTITSCIEKLEHTKTVQEMMGLEGAAANAYFKAFKALLPAQFNFPGRRRRPPKDPVNVLLSYGYTLLQAKVSHLVLAAGLNPHLGNLHAEGPATHSLVCDLMEEFRALVVDSVVLALCRNNKISNTDFRWFSDAETPCFLEATGRKTFLNAVETKLRSTLIHPGQKRVMDHTALINAQIQHYTRVLLREEFLYKGLLTK